MDDAKTPAPAPRRRVYWIGLSSSLATWAQFLWADGVTAPPGGSAYHHWGAINSE
jgi:hypothetical protein